MPFRKDVAVLATLIALVGDMPLECKIIHLNQLEGSDYLSPAPQALPQAAGFSSAGLSPAPQALPQAAGFSSAGLSPAPQALPQAAVFSLCFNNPCALCARFKSILFIVLTVFEVKHYRSLFVCYRCKDIHFLQMDNEGTWMYVGYQKLPMGVYRRLRRD